MIINDNDVGLVAEPKSLFKIIRMINQWIENIVKYYEDKSVINNEQTWYRKWKALYPIVRSSKRSVIEVYRFITEDLLAPTATVLDVLKYFINTIPELENYQQLTSTDNEPINPNYMRYQLSLYHTPYNDPNNRFSTIASDNDDKYCSFKDNRSIMTWNTAQSVDSIHSVPNIVTMNKVTEKSKSVNNDNEQIVDTPLSNDSNISLSDTKLSPNALNPNQDD
jgi:hypothetical protein